MGTIKKVGQKERVYNLRIADCNEYFANNILVHNCMALLIALRMLSKARSVNMSNEIEQPDYGPNGFWMQGQYFGKDGMPASPEGFQNDEIYSGDEW